MIRCPMCVTGLLTKSGCHIYCDKCSYTSFEMTQDYIHQASCLLAELVSNTKYPTRHELGRSILANIEMHLPKLDLFFSNIVVGRTEFLAKIMESVEDLAINLQIGADIVNEVTAEKQLRCTCGAEDFKMLTVGSLACKCGAYFKINVATGMYVPVFQCSCGCIRHSIIDALLVECDDCGLAFLHNSEEDTFKQIGGK